MVAAPAPPELGISPETFCPGGQCPWLDGRGMEPSPTFSYKLFGGPQASGFGLDVAIGDELEVDEGHMSLVIPFADGQRRDGVGDLLEIGGIRLDRHRINPVVLFDHGKQVVLPIGMAEDPESREYTVNLDTVAQKASLKCFFYQGKGPIPEGVEVDEQYKHAVFCEQLFDLAAKRFIRGGSIGYQVIHAKQLSPDYDMGVPQGLHLLAVLMLEGSLVVMPANQETVRKTLSLPTICGKPLSPYLVKCLQPYAQKKVQLGYTPQLDQNQTKPDLTQPHRTSPHLTAPDHTTLGNVNCTKNIENGKGLVGQKMQAMRPDEENYRSVVTGDAPHRVAAMHQRKDMDKDCKCGCGGTCGCGSGKAAKQGEPDKPWWEKFSFHVGNMGGNVEDLRIGDVNSAFRNEEEPAVAAERLVKALQAQKSTPVPLQSVRDYDNVPPAAQRQHQSTVKPNRTAERKLHVQGEGMKAYGDDPLDPRKTPIPKIHRQHEAKPQQQTPDLQEVTRRHGPRGENVTTANQLRPMSEGQAAYAEPGSHPRPFRRGRESKPQKGIKAQPSSNISSDKACQILKDGEVRGHKLTDAQRGMFGAACGRKKKSLAELRAKYFHKDEPRPQQPAKRPSATLKLNARQQAEGAAAHAAAASKPTVSQAPAIRYGTRQAAKLDKDIKAEPQPAPQRKPSQLHEALRISRAGRPKVQQAAPKRRVYESARPRRTGGGSRSGSSYTSRQAEEPRQYLSREEAERRLFKFLRLKYAKALSLREKAAPKFHIPPGNWMSEPHDTARDSYEPPTEQEFHEHEMSHGYEQADREANAPPRERYRQPRKALPVTDEKHDATRERRMKDEARRRYYADHRSQRFRERMGFATPPPGVQRHKKPAPASKCFSEMEDAYEEAGVEVGKKSLDALRKKYRPVNRLRRRLKKSVPGSSLIHVNAKDYEAMRAAAETRGIKASRIGDVGQRIKVKLTGDDGSIDALAAEYGLPLPRRQRGFARPVGRVPGRTRNRVSLSPETLLNSEDGSELPEEVAPLRNTN